jgi:hypothetical protein
MGAVEKTMTGAWGYRGSDALACLSMLEGSLLIYKIRPEFGKETKSLRHRLKRRSSSGVIRVE